MASRISIFQPRRLGVAGVHAEQVAGEQRGLLAALPRLHLEDRVLVVGGVARARAAGAAAPRRRGGARPAPRPRRRRSGPRRRARGRRRGRRRARCHSRQAPMIRLSSAYRWLSCLASRASACVSGAPSRRSSSACSASEPLDGLEHRPPLGDRDGCGQTTSADPARVRGSALGGSYLLSASSASWRPSWRSGPRTGRRGRRCRGSSACRCRTGGTASTRRRGWCRTSRCCGW